jgi:2-amino-4-hydroxy-6-hydroxymethyldihydropteridine diphosphokinase
MMLVLVGLGANLPGRFGASPAATLEAAIAALAGHGAMRLLARSRLWDSAAWPDPSGPRYLNAVAAFRGTPDPAALLAWLHGLEAAEGRVRGAANAPRPLDLDLLAAGDLVQHGIPQLPHPRIADRGFVLGPLVELVPGWRHPVLGATAAELLARLPPGDFRPWTKAG